MSYCFYSVLRRGAQLQGGKRWPLFVKKLARAVVEIQVARGVGERGRASSAWPLMPMLSAPIKYR